MCYAGHMAKYKAHPRFSAGALVMFSKKNRESTHSFKYMLPKGDPIPGDKWLPVDRLSNERIVGDMPRGVPFMLLNDPEFISLKSDPTRWRQSPMTEKRWKLRILYGEKIYHMYLTKRQHDAMLVKAVPRRLNKDYSDKSTSRT